MAKQRGARPGAARGDVTINDYANAPKPTNRLKKSNIIDASEDQDSWEQLDADCDIVEEVDADGNKRTILKQRTRKPEKFAAVDGPSLEYPEIIWYLISRYIKPELVGAFAGINRTTYAITKRESFWRCLYRRFCQGHKSLPERLRVEKSYKLFGLRQRVIRALHHTHDVFVNKIAVRARSDAQPRLLVRHRCVNVWYCKSTNYWLFYFKFKRASASRDNITSGVNMLNLLGDIDANPEENSQVLQVACKNFYEVPPLMGMTLCSVSVLLSQGFRHHRMHLGFNSGSHVSREITPDSSLVLDTVVNISVWDWWHPKYPHFDNALPHNVMFSDDERIPVLTHEFFNGDV